MIRLAIVGAGRSGSKHAKHFNASDNVLIDAVCDIDHERAEAFAITHSIQNVYTSIECMLKSAVVDGVIVATPDETHCSTALKVITMGKHVLCEKPLATSIEDAMGLVKAAKRHNVVNMVHFVHRAAPAIQKVKRLVENGTLGRICHVEAEYFQDWLISKSRGDWSKEQALLWRLSTSHGNNGVLSDIGSHLLDLILFVVGEVSSIMCRLWSMPKALASHGVGQNLDANDSSIIIAELASSGMATLSVTRCAAGHYNDLQMRVFGEKGAISLALKNSTDTLHICRGQDVQTANWRKIRCPGTTSIRDLFIKSIQTGRTHEPDFTAGARIQQLINACIESNNTGKKVVV